MDKSTFEEHLPQPFQSLNKLFKIAVTMLTGYKGTFSITNKKTNCSTVSINHDGFSQLTIPAGAYEKESLNKEFRHNITKEGFFQKKIFQL